MEKFQICGQWLKKGHQNFWRMKIEKFFGKGKIGKIFHGVRIFFRKYGGNLTQGEMHRCLRGMDALHLSNVILIRLVPASTVNMP